MRPVQSNLVVVVVQAPQSPTELGVTDVTHVEALLELLERLCPHGTRFGDLRENSHSKFRITGHDFLLIVEVRALSSFTDTPYRIGRCEVCLKTKNAPVDFPRRASLSKNRNYDVEDASSMRPSSIHV